MKAINSCNNFSNKTWKNLVIDQKVVANSFEMIKPSSLENDEPEFDIDFENEKYVGIKKS